MKWFFDFADYVVSFVIEKYVHEGKEVNLTCPMKIEIANLTWRGPPKLKLYSTRTTESNIQNIRVIHVGSTNENILKIVKFETNNEGLYQCTSLYGGEDTFKVTILREYRANVNSFATLHTIFIIKERRMLSIATSYHYIQK